MKPTIERTPKGDIIYVLDDGSWKYLWEWIVTTTKQEFNEFERNQQQNND
tara:strand:+ start:757 stop:906 length:150 start_codon:yes stop_codon:yes gene_type:complete